MLCGYIPAATPALVSACSDGLRVAPDLEGAPAVVAIEVPIRLIQVPASVAPTLEAPIHVGVLLFLP